MTPQWKDFFNVLTPVSATILGLLFVALQINVIRWDIVPVRQVSAYRHLIELGTPVGVGLVALYPGGRWWLGGFIGGGIGLASVLGYWVLFFILRRQPKTWFEYVEVTLGSLVSVVLYVGLIIGSWPNNGFGLNLVGALCIWAVMAGVTQSWVVLVVKAPTAAAAEAPGVDRRNPS